MTARRIFPRSIAFATSVVRFTGRRSAAAGMLVASGAIVEGLGIALLIPLLTILTDGSDTSAAFVRTWVPMISMDSPVASLTLLMLAFAVVMILRALLLWRRDVLLGALQVEFVEAHRVAIARGMAVADWESLVRLGHGRVTHILTGDIQRCGVGVHFLFQGSVAVVVMAVQLSLAFALSPSLALIAVLLMVIGASALWSLFRRSDDLGASVTQAQLTLTVSLGQYLNGMKLALSQNLQAGFVTAFERELRRSSQKQAAFVGQQAVMRGAWSLVGALVAGVTVLIGYSWFQIPAAVLITLLVLLARVAGPASMIQLGLQQIAYSLAAFEALAELEEQLASAAVSAPASEAADKLEGAIVLDRVSYHHGDQCGDQRHGIDRLRWRIEPHSIIGLVGASGAGKTTLADLVAGLISPQEGRISIGGTELTQANIAVWRDKLSYVAQDPVLFNDTVRQNLLWSKPEATEEELWAVLAIVGAEEFVNNLPDELDSTVGEGGALVSGGERQRVALARALLRKPSLLILDEATSAIDVQSERKILLELQALSPRPTIILIAHRAESLAVCNHVATLAGGRLTFDRDAVSNPIDTPA